jgi:heme-degrading monooxygenase HmoA
VPGSDSPVWSSSLQRPTKNSAYSDKWQRARFSSAAGYEKFKNIFADVRHHLKTLPGFLHLTFWVHPEDPGWYNEISLWTSKEALQDWHMNTYHKHAKEWAAQSGAIMEDIITNFELASTRLLCICPVCNKFQDKPTTWQKNSRC